MKKWIVASLCIAVAGAFATLAGAGDKASMTGEVLDLACYVAKGAAGADHAGCAKKCVEMGQPMGLLTADGDVVLLAADHANGEPYESLKAMAGKQAKVSGPKSEKGGMTMVTVQAAEPAS